MMGATANPDCGEPRALTNRRKGQGVPSGIGGESALRAHSGRSWAAWRVRPIRRFPAVPARSYAAGWREERTFLRLWRGGLGCAT